MSNNILIDVVLLIISVFSQVSAAIILLGIALFRYSENKQLYYLLSIFLFCIVSPLTIYNLLLIRDVMDFSSKLLLSMISITVFSFVLFLNQNSKKNKLNNALLEKSQGSLKLRNISIFLGLLAIFSSTALGYLGYNISRTSFMENIKQTTVSLSNVMSLYFNQRLSSHSDKIIIKEAQLLWNNIKPDNFDYYLTIIDNQGKIKFDSFNIDEINVYVGNQILNHRPEIKIKDLIQKNASWYGENNNYENSKIISYTIVPELNYLVAVYIPKDKIDKQIEENALPWLIGFIFITVIILPLSLGLLNWAFINSQKSIIKSQKALKESEEKFRQMAENIRQIFWIYDNNTKKLLYVSNAYQEIMGKDYRSLYLNPLFFFRQILREDRELVKEVLKSKITGFNELIFRIQNENNQIKYLSTKIFPIKGHDGVIYRITGITEDITDRRLAEEKIKDSLEEKEILLKEIHHRVKNNLQIIYSMLGLQTKYIKDSKYLDMLGDSQQRIKTMAIIHEKLYQTDDFAKINFREYVENLCQYLHESYRLKNNFELDLQIEDISLNIDTAIPCGLIINELFSNALKHAFDKKEGNIIKISFFRKEALYYLELSDNGLGLPDNINIRRSDSLGLKLVNTLVKQIKGKIEISHLEINNISQKKGTKFKISFKGKSS